MARVIRHIEITMEKIQETIEVLDAYLN